MSDAVVLLSISQVVCLGGMAYLYMQFQGLTRRGPRPRHANAHIVERPAVHMREQVREPHNERRPIAATAAARAYASPLRAETPTIAAANPAVAAVAPAAARALAADGAVDVTAIARRMNKSEEEVRLLLRRQAVRH